MPSLKFPRSRGWPYIATGRGQRPTRSRRAWSGSSCALEAVGGDHGAGAGGGNGAPVHDAAARRHSREGSVLVCAGGIGWPVGRRPGIRQGRVSDGEETLPQFEEVLAGFA